MKIRINEFSDTDKKKTYEIWYWEEYDGTAPHWNKLHWEDDNGARKSKVKSVGDAYDKAYEFERHHRDMYGRIAKEDDIGFS